MCFGLFLLLHEEQQVSKVDALGPRPAGQVGGRRPRRQGVAVRHLELLPGPAPNGQHGSAVGLFVLELFLLEALQLFGLGSKLFLFRVLRLGPGLLIR